MRKHFFSLILMLSFLTTKSQVSSSCVPSSYILDNYSEDILDLALSRMNESGVSDTNSLVILPSYKQEVIEVLAAVSNSSFLESDSIFNLYCIHNDQQFFSRYEITVALDTSVAWTFAWLNQQAFSNQSSIDSLLNGLTYTVTNTGFNQTVTLAFDSVINLSYLARFLESQPGVVSAYQSGVIANGNSIEISTLSSSVVSVSFNLTWGDCFAGCLYQRRWTFEVDTSTCVVSYKGAFGVNVSFPGNGVFPPILGCNLTTFTTSKLQQLTEVFPNPSKGFINVKSNRPVGEVQVFNLLGEVVLVQRFTQRSFNLNLKSLPSGTYLVKVGPFVSKLLLE